MPTSYTSLLGLALPVSGELSGSWGDTVNNAITSLLDTAVAGTTSLTTDADVTLTTTTGATNQARQAVILWNPASGTVTRNITAPAQSKIYTVINASGGTQSIVFRGAGPTTGVTILKGESAVVAWNGADFIKISNTGGVGSFTNVTISGTTTLSGGTANGVAYLNGSKVLTTGTAMTFDGSILGVGATLSTWGTAVKAMQVGSGAALAGRASGVNDELNLTANYYLNSGSTWSYIAARAASRYRMTAGAHEWYTAPVGIANDPVAETTQMLLTVGGFLGVGTVAPAAKLHVYGNIEFGATTTPVLYVHKNATVSSAGPIGRISFAGDTASSSLVLAASVRAAADAAWTDLSNPTYLTFFTTSPDSTTEVERMRVDSSGNVQTSTGAQVVWAPAPASIAAAATLTNANIQGQIINTTGTTYTVTMPLGTTLDTLVAWATTGLGYDFTVINTASGTITMAVNTGVTSLGALTIATGTSAQFRIRRTAASTYILYRRS